MAAMAVGVVGLTSILGCMFAFNIGGAATRAAATIARGGFFWGPPRGPDDPLFFGRWLNSTIATTTLYWQVLGVVLLALALGISALLVLGAVGILGLV